MGWAEGAAGVVEGWRTSAVAIVDNKRLQDKLNMNNIVLTA